MSADVPADRVLPATTPAQVDPNLIDGERLRIGAVLNTLARSDNLLDPWGPHASVSDATMFLPTPANAPIVPRPPRLRLHREVEEEPAIAMPGDPPAGAVLFTAGAPGAGKSFRLDALGLLDGARLVDPDIYKERLLKRLIEVGDPWLFDRRAQVEARLGVPVAPLEMSAVVHRESLALAEIALHEALRASDRVVFAGTCTDEQFVRRMLRIVRDSGRDQCRILLVEVPEELACKQAESRWWSGRKAFERGESPMGARYVPPAVIARGYRNGKSLASQTIANIMADPEPGVRLVIVAN